ncbi:cytidylyltransferase domain-containing protein [Verrucomicrobiota bacterium]
MNILALIPARGGSRSIPMKNIVDMGGKPLIAYSIEVALKSELISRVVVSTDSQKIADISRESGAEVPFMRPEELAGDTTTDLPVFQHALKWLNENEDYVPGIVVQLRPTTPLRRVKEVDEAVQLLIDDPDADSVRCVSNPVENPFKMWTIENTYLKPLLDAGIQEPYNQPRQKLPEVYWQNGYADVIRHKTIAEKNSMTGDKILPYILGQRFVVDIDHPFSLKIAELLLQNDLY